MTLVRDEPPVLVAPPLHRRLGCLAYDAILLIAIAVGISMVFTTVSGRARDQDIFLFRAIYILAFGIYFSYAWNRSGQTLPMKTWHIKVVSRNSQILNIPQAMIRYITSWLWISPLLLYHNFIGISNKLEFITALLGGMLVYSMLSFLFFDKQYIHDKICRTRLIDTRTI